MPGTNPEWGMELPDNLDNSLVDKNGKPWDNGCNFGEKNDDKEEQNQAPEQADEAIAPNQTETPATSFDNLSEQVKFDPESAERVREEEQSLENLPETPSETLSGNPTENPENA